MRITLIRCSAVSPVARLIMPAPAAIPTAAVTQILAAVVRPTTMLRRVKITPAPRNPIPLTICAAIRDGSRRASSPSTALKPDADTNVKTAEPHPTRTWVRNPALFCLNWRSIPINEHNTNATNNRPSSVSELEVHRLTRCTFFVSYARGHPAAPLPSLGSVGCCRVPYPVACKRPRISMARKHQGHIGRSPAFRLQVSAASRPGCGQRAAEPDLGRVKGRWAASPPARDRRSDVYG